MKARKVIVAVLLLGLVLCFSTNTALAAFTTHQQFITYTSKFGYSLMTFGNPEGGTSIWVECAKVTVNAKAAGVVYVQGQGMVLLPNNSTVVTLSLSTTSATRGPWVFSMGDTSGLGDNHNTYGVGMVFEVPSAGTYTYYLNGCSYIGTPGTYVSVETGALTATWYPSLQVTGPAEATDVAAPEAEGPTNKSKE